MKQERSFLGLPQTEEADTAQVHRKVARLEHWLLKRLLHAMGDPPIRIALWDGNTRYLPTEGTRNTLVIRDRGALWRLLTNPGLHFGDDYSAGRLDVEGGLVEFVEAVYRARPTLNRHTLLYRLAFGRSGRRRRNSPAGSRENIHHHYDIGNEFYRLWLDPQMAYTCAYFPDPATSLTHAQIAKMEHICRKLRLQPGQRVVEAGCGWGGLARYMAGRHDVHVTAYNIAREQIAYARGRARADGLDHRVQYVEDDYRNISGKFDAFVSVGMLEHVGVDHYRELGGAIHRCLKPSGVGLIHTIGQNQPEAMNPWIEKRIFPGAYPPTLAEMMDIFEPHGLTVLDVENLRLHYTKTLEHWLQRFDERTDDVLRMFDAAFVRAWRLYLAASIANFSTGWLQLFQVVFARSTNNELPWSRTHLYTGGT